jgi:O-antigen/teichoic acid export membrane protein
VKTHSKNILSLLGFDLGNRLLGFVVTAYIARIFGTDGFGAINYGMAILSFMILFASPGVHIIGTRFISQRIGNASSLVRKITTLRFILAIIVCAVVCGASFVFISSRELRLVVILYALSVFPFAFQIEWFFQGKEQIAIIGMNRFLATLVFTVGIFSLTHLTPSLFIVPVSFFISSAVNAASLYMTMKRKSTELNNTRGSAFDLNVPTIPWRSLLFQALPIGSAGILAQIVLNLPVFLLGIFSTTTEIGNYSAASKIVFFLLAIDRAIYFLFYPLIARNFALAPKNVSALVHRAVRYTFIAAAPLCAGGVILAQPIVNFIFSKNYGNAIVLFQILIFYFLFTILNSIFAYVLIAGGKEKRYSAVTIGLSTILIAVLTVAAARWNAIGAAITMAAGEGVMMTVMFFEVKKIVALRNYSFALVTLLSSALMAVAVFSLRQYPIPAVLIGIIIYCSCLVILKALTKDDIIFLRERLV